ncbi:MAG: nucleotidyltransferase family protein [Verrucomicrobia bacterium]|nr:nucleotidyltransferase family protein [Verrucomicrobiota bacterium]MBV9658458.1 nucleotidyltransferase family protein [Verrucomicrobiota bacterium]
MENVRRRLLRASAALEAAGIPYAVVGGNAVAAWVSRVDESAVRNTRDVDLLLRRDDLAAARAALEAAGFHHRRVASLGRTGAMDVFLDGPDARVGDAVHIVFAGEKTLPTQPEPNARIEEIEAAGEFRLVSLEALVRMKLTAFRDKDRVHLRDLLAVGLIDASWLPRLPESLRARLEEIFATPEG